MTKAQIITLIQDIALMIFGTGALDVYYSDVLEEVSKRMKPPLVDAELFSITAGTADYSFPSSAVRPIAFFHGSKHLSPSFITDLEAYDAAWRALSGSAFAYSTEHVNARIVKYTPTPDVDSGDMFFPHAAPFGEDYPTDIGCMIFSQVRDVDIPDWIALFIALRVLSKEFTRPSDHQDTEFAQGCERLADIFYKLGGME